MGLRILFILLPIVVMIGLGIAIYFLIVNREDVIKVNIPFKRKEKRFDGTTGQFVEVEIEDKKIETKTIIKKKNIILTILSGVGILVMLAVLIIVPGSIHQVEAGQIAVVKVWGNAKETRTAGIYFDNWMSHKYEIYDAKVQQVTVTTPAYSNDGQTMNIELVVQYQIQQDKVIEIAKEYGGLEMLESRIETISIERMKSVISQKSAMTIIETRSEVSANTTRVISEAITADYYITIVNVVLTNIDFSDEFEATVEDKMIAEQQKLKAEYEKEKVTIEAEAQLEKAKKEAQAKIAAAEAEATSIELKAEAEAEALRLVEDAWKNIDNETKQAILKKLAIEQWDGKMPETLVGDDFLKDLLGSIG